MTQSIAGQPAPELAVPYWIDGEGKERPPLALKERGTGFSFSTNIGAAAATRSDFQLSRRWLNIRTQDVAVQNAFEGAYVNTRDKLPPDRQSYGLRIPFGHKSRSSLRVLPTTMESRIEVATLAVRKTLDHKAPRPYRSAGAAEAGESVAFHLRTAAARGEDHPRQRPSR